MPDKTKAKPKTQKPSAERKSRQQLMDEITQAASKRSTPITASAAGLPNPPALTRKPFYTQRGAGGLTMNAKSSVPARVGFILDGQDVDEDYVANTLANVDRVLSIYEAVVAVQQQEWRRSDATLLLQLVNTLQLLTERVHLLRTAESIGRLNVVDRLEVILKLAMQAGDLRLAEQTARNINELQVLGGPTDASAKVLDALHRVREQNKDRAKNMLSVVVDTPRKPGLEDDSINGLVHSFLNDRKP